MTSILVLLISALLLTASVRAAKEEDKHEGHEKHDKHEKHPSCQEFTQGLTFNDSQALGTWKLLHYKTQTENGTGDSKCVEFSLVNDQERKNLSEVIGKFVENMNWEKLTLKMQIPCKSGSPNLARDYFLEKLEGDGSYRTLLIPPPNTKPDLSGLNRYPMRLKVIEGQYLGMMDCHEKFVFLLGKQQPQDSETDARLQKMMEQYWPEEH